jgi:hypothetical protein
MTDDDLLRRLAELARKEEDEQRRERRWEALAAGELSAEETEQLRREAGDSATAKAKHDAFSPLGPDFRARVVAAIRQEHEGDAEPQAPAPPPRVRDIGDRRPAAPPRRRGALRWAAAGLAAAALLAIALWPHGQPPLPGYAARLTGGVETMRAPGEPEDPVATDGEPTVFAPGNAFELVLTPAEPVTGRLTVATFVTPAGGVPRPLTLPAELSEHGAVRLAGRVGSDVDLPAGASELLVAVGRPGRLPPPDTLVELLAGRHTTDGRGWVAWRLPVVLGEPPEPP